MNDPMENERRSASGAGNRLWQQSRWVLILPLLAGLLLRGWWVWRFGMTTVDSRIYGEFARNMLEHGVYGYTNLLNGVLKPPTPTLIRLPGYPLFLAVCFRLFGMENYTAVMLVQIVVDLGTCLVLGGIAARIFGRRAGPAALWLAALCPFIANYVSVPLTETLTLACIALAFYAVVRWDECGSTIDRWLFVAAFALSYAILLRPEQGLMAAAVVPAMGWIGWRKVGLVPAMRRVVLVALLTLLPLVPWTARNWRVFHVFQPLAPRYATDPGQLINFGFQRWFRTWGVEFASTDNVYWNYDGTPLQIADLPNRAFDSNAQYLETEALFADYNVTMKPTRQIDACFERIAEERIHADPMRYYLALPVARVLNMMLRPRTEILPVPVEWWKFRRAGDWFSLGYAALNAAFFVLAGVGFGRRSAWREHAPVVWAMVATIGLRVLLLLTVDNSEPRYTLEFFPVLIVLASAVLYGGPKGSIQSALDS